MSSDLHRRAQPQGQGEGSPAFEESSEGSAALHIPPSARGRPGGARGGPGLQQQQPQAGLLTQAVEAVFALVALAEFEILFVAFVVIVYLWVKDFMFRNTFQSGFLSILYSLGSKPLQLWTKEVGEGGSIERVTDPEIQSSAIELSAPNIRGTFITCPPDPAASLGIKLPFLTLVLAVPPEKYFSFEVEVLDDKSVRRRFRGSNFQAITRVKPYICTMPLRLEDGWNTLLFNLADFTRRAYGTNFVETLRVQVHANCRLRRVYFSDKLYSDDELPPEFKIYLPIQPWAKLNTDIALRFVDEAIATMIKLQSRSGSSFIC